MSTAERDDHPQTSHDAGGAASLGMGSLAAFGVAGVALVVLLALALLEVPVATLRQWTLILGVLALAAASVGLHALVRDVARPLREATRLARSMARGDLSPTPAGRGARHDILAALEELRARTFGAVADVRARALAIATSSGHVGADQGTFAEAVRAQAQSLESTASSLEEVTAAVQHNAENAARAHELAVSTLDVAAQGRQVVQEVVQTMGSIRGSSDKIVDIIGVIDGIAFQTNILALNASVEAARAGDQGRGFAVVASEVRALATRSAEAAKAVKALIEGSVEAVTRGSELVEGAGDTMKQIVGSVENVTAIMTEMSAAAREQSAGVGEINRAIIDVDAATQRNVSLFERARAPLTALHEQAMALTEAVDFFVLGESEFGNEEEALALVRRGGKFIAAHGEQAFIEEVMKGDKGQLMDRDLYLSVYDINCICRAHAVNPRVNGTDVSGVKDLDGRPIVVDIVNAAKRDGEGRIVYRWEHPLTHKALLKTTRFERHGDLILACGASSAA